MSLLIAAEEVSLYSCTSEGVLTPIRHALSPTQWWHLRSAAVAYRVRMDLEESSYRLLNLVTETRTFFSCRCLFLAFKVLLCLKQIFDALDCLALGNPRDHHFDSISESLQTQTRNAPVIWQILSRLKQRICRTAGFETTLARCSGRSQSGQRDFILIALPLTISRRLRI